MHPYPPHTHTHHHHTTTTPHPQLPHHTPPATHTCTNLHVHTKMRISLGRLLHVVRRTRYAYEGELAGPVVDSVCGWKCARAECLRSQHKLVERLLSQKALKLKPPLFCPTDSTALGRHHHTINAKGSESSCRWSQSPHTLFQTHTCNTTPRWETLARVCCPHLHLILTSYSEHIF